MSHNVPTLGRLQPVDLREVWVSEPYNFTPWLAEPENLEFLAEALGLPGLELVKAEHAVDSFSADIVARIIDSEHHVLIENQLERTDHIHLGQLLTYAPRFDAKVVIWVARQFTEAHRAALDWLNSITDERYGFFGVEVQAVKIGDSLPAPQLNVIAKPNSWTRPAVLSASGEQENLSDIALSNIEYWDAFHKVAVAAGAPLRKIDKPLKDTNYWVQIAPNGSAYLSAWRSQAKRNPTIGAFLVVYNAPAEFLTDYLVARREMLDAAYGAELDWQPAKPGSAFKIVERLPVVDPYDQADWPRQHAWLAERLKKLEDVFAATVSDALSDYEASIAQTP
ncbi:MAG TPA: DUF4268 domain-containing protein [Sphingomicrobium sp.]|nr:DUF4268 domain-containing protein [Sphingomicrobium sp.]